MSICNICLNQLNRNITQCRACESQFHVTCWQEWMKFGKGCPNCRHCVQNELLCKLIPDIPTEISESLTSFEKYNLCKIAIIITIYKNLTK